MHSNPDAYLVLTLASIGLGLTLYFLSKLLPSENKLRELLESLSFDQLDYIGMLLLVIGAISLTFYYA